MRILHVVAGLDLGGAETLLVNLIQESSIRGDLDQYFLCFGEEKEFYYSNRILDNGGKIVFIPSPKIYNPIKHIIDLKKIVNQIGDIDIVHIHTHLHSGLVSYAMRNMDLKTIVHSHSSEDNSNSKSYVRRIYEYISKELIYRNTDYFISVSEKAQKYLFPKIKNNDINISIFKNFINTKLFICDKKAQDRTITISMVGRLEIVKNHMFALEVISRLQKHTDNKFKFKIFGDGSLFNEIQQEISKKSIYNTEMLGSVSNISDALKETDILIMPSLYEGFPMVLLEAQAASCKCLISSNIDESVNIGLGLVEFLDVESVDDWVKSLANNMSKKTILDSSLIEKRFNENKYDSTVALEELMRLYNSIIE